MLKPMTTWGGTWRGNVRLTLLQSALAVRWMILLLVPIQSGIIAHGHTARANAIWIGIAIAAVYTTIVTLNIRRIGMALHRQPLYGLVDLAILTALYFIDNGPSLAQSEPFFAFGTTSILLWGLSGDLRVGIGAGFVWGSITNAVCWLSGWPMSQLTNWTTIEDMFGIMVLAGIWTYGVSIALSFARVRAHLDHHAEELAASNEALNRRQSEILGMLDVGKAILTKLDVNDVVEVILHALAEMGFPRCELWLPDTSRAIAELPSDGEPLLVRDTTTFDGRTVLAPAVIVPVIGDGALHAALVVEGEDESLFEPARLDLLSLFADEIELALQHLRLYRQASEYAVAAERNRLALDLHDTVVQKLYGANLLLDAALVPEGSDEMKLRLGALKDNVAAAVADLRFYVLEWDSVEWASALADLVGRYIEEFSSLSGLPVSLSVSGDPRDLPPAIAKDLLRVAQEALSNAWQHARASGARVTLAFDTRGVTLSVADDGVGFDADAAESREGIGLRNMWSRAKRHDGEFRVDSAPGRTTVRVWVPC